MASYNFKEGKTQFWDLGLRVIQDLETENGILASGRHEIYGCIFGRDSLITSLKLLKVYQKTDNSYFLSLVKKILLNLCELQGTEVNIESGEEPGKCIHEFRPDNHEHLTKHASRPWFVYPDNAMRNYDTVDATPLFLIATHMYYTVSGDEDFMKKILPKVYDAIDWILVYGDSNHDGFVDYRFHPDRTYGGLKTQSWMDSSESVFHEDGSTAEYPIAPVEVQAYTYVALRAWASYFRESYPERGRQLKAKALRLKEQFNQKFVVKDKLGLGLAFAIDGNGLPLVAPRSSMGHCLWAVWKRRNGSLDGILEEKYIPGVARRLMLPDLFEPLAGIRTLSSFSSRFDPYSYHNGSIWPHDTAIVAAGLENFGFTRHASRVRRALLSAFWHFQTPIELFVFADGEYREYDRGGQTACKTQAWSAASLLAHSVS